MRAIVVHTPGNNIYDLRLLLLGVGADCCAEDCVPWDGLAVRLANRDAQLIVVAIESASEPNWANLREAGVLSSAPIVVVGPADANLSQAARNAGAAAYLDSGERLRGNLEKMLEQLAGSGRLQRRRGRVISVLASAPGSGGSTVTANLAVALAAKYSQGVALVELAHDFGDLALLLNVQPQHTVTDVLRRWETLDLLSLRNHFQDHRAGLQLLLHAFGPAASDAMHPQAVRRLAVLARIAFDFTVLAIDSRVSDAEIEAIQLSDHVVLVMRPDVLGVRRAKWATEQITARGIQRERIHPVVNRWGQSGQLAWKLIEASLGMKIDTSLPDHPALVNKATNHGQVLTELSRHARLTRAFSALASAVSGQG